jgi:putative aldouronate transport system substrate-binding protein
MKRNKIQIRLLVAGLSIVTMSSIFAGCNKDTKKDTEVTTNTSGKVSDKPITFKMLYADNSGYPFNKDWPTLKKMTELTNVTLDIQVVPDSDYGTKKQIIFNSGEIPDIVARTGESGVKDYVMNETFIPISDYVDKMPNFKKIIDTAGLSKEINNMKEENGKYYSIPMNIYTKKFQPEQWVIRKDIFEKNNIKVPTTTDELYKAAKTLKEKYPDSYPIINKFGSGNILSMIAPSFGTVAGWGMSNGGYSYDEKSNKWISAATSNEYKAMLQYVNKLVNENLLDKEFATLDSNVYDQKIQTGKGFIAGEWYDPLPLHTDSGKKTDPNYLLEPILPLAGPTGTAKSRAQGQITDGWVIPSNIKSKSYFNTLINYVDWFYGQDATDLFTWGVENVSYKVVNGNKQYIDEVISGKKYAPKEFGVLNNNLTVVKPMEWLTSTSNMTPAVAKVYNDISAKNLVPEPDPSLRLTDTDREQEKLIRAKVEDYVNQMTQKFIFGKESFDSWDNYVKEYNNMGGKTLGELYNKAWDKQKTK